MKDLVNAIKDLQSRLKDNRLSKTERQTLQSRLKSLIIHLMVIS